MESYLEEIHNVISRIPRSIVDISIPKERGKAPTQAFSEFLTNREQGDWAERLIVSAVNQHSEEFVAVQYGKSDERIAGETGFEVFYEEYQDELETIGKRPDLLLFRKADYQEDWQYNISRYSREVLDSIVPKAVVGIEIRSSSFLLEKYNAEIRRKQQQYTATVFHLRDTLLQDFSNALSEEWNTLLRGISASNVDIVSFRVPSWKANPRLAEASRLLAEMKSAMKGLQKRDFLSFTPKVEDVKVVLKWIETYNIPHIYLQVFFDKVYGISFRSIVEIIANPDNEETKFFAEGDVKNQNKIVLKISVKEGIEVAHRVDMPHHASKMKELDRGRLLFHVVFDGGKAYLNPDAISQLIETRFA